jgi:hypothetical protein
MEPVGCHRKMIHSTREPGSLTQNQDGFQLWDESQKELEIRSQANCEAEDCAVKGRDDRQRTAPLTPQSSPPEIPTLFLRKQPKKQH